MCFFRYRRQCNKRTGEWTAVPLKEDKKYSYIPQLQLEIIIAKVEDRQTMSRKRPRTSDDPRELRPNISKMLPPPTAEIIKKKEKYTRFKSEVLIFHCNQITPLYSVAFYKDFWCTQTNFMYFEIISNYQG